jgi:hypothetical protein
MGAKLAVALLVSIPSFAQVQPAANRGIPREDERRRGNGLSVGRLESWEHQQVGARRMGNCNDLALPRGQCGGPLHDRRRKPASFQL